MSEENYDKTSMQGRRIEQPADILAAVDSGDLKKGDYYKDAEGNWQIIIPTNIYPVRITGNESPQHNWSVTAHEDGTITVSPSIHSVRHWHGYLEKGFWRSC